MCLPGISEQDINSHTQKNCLLREAYWNSISLSFARSSSFLRDPDITWLGAFGLFSTVNLGFNLLLTICFVIYQQFLHFSRTFIWLKTVFIFQTLNSPKFKAVGWGWDSVLSKMLWLKLYPKSKETQSGHRLDQLLSLKHRHTDAPFLCFNFQNANELPLKIQVSFTVWLTKEKNNSTTFLTVSRFIKHNVSSFLWVWASLVTKMSI